MNAMSRTLLREHIFKIIFEAEFHDHDEMQENISKYLDNISDEKGIDIIISDEDRDYIANKAADVIKNLDKADEFINKASQGWSINRLGKSELAILRLAVYEMKIDDLVPENVAINEAIELTKKYGDMSAPPFINGILGSIKNYEEAKS